jgi:hypothetical protein
MGDIFIEDDMPKANLDVEEGLPAWQGVLYKWQSTLLSRIGSVTKWESRLFNNNFIRDYLLCRAIYANDHA